MIHLNLINTNDILYLPQIQRVVVSRSNLKYADILCQSGYFNVGDRRFILNIIRTYILVYGFIYRTWKTI
jgi:hypothetical protein